VNLPVLPLRGPEGLNLLSPAQEEENFFSESFTNVTAGIAYTKSN
jgi:hypothetical protein